MIIKIRKFFFRSTNKYMIYIIIMLLVMAKNGFYLWGENDYIINGLFKYSDIGIVFGALWGTYVLIKYKSVPNSNGKYRYDFAFFFLIAIVSAVTAYLIFGQSFFRGLFAQRVQLGWFFMYFPIIKLLKTNKISEDDLLSILYFFAIYELVITTIIYIFPDIGIFSIKTGSRYDETRYYFNISLILTVAFRAFYNILNNKKRLRNIALYAWILCFSMVFTKMRAITVLLLVTSFIGIVIWRKNLVKKIFIFSIIICLTYFFIGKSVLLIDAINGIKNLKEVGEMNIRFIAQEHYINEFLKTPITGRGYPSISSYEAYSAAGWYNYMYFSDNGIFGLIYSYGVLGILWYILFWRKLFFRSWKFRKIDASHFCYYLFYTLGIMLDFAWFWSANFTFVLFTCIFESKFDQVDKNKVKEIGRAKNVT